MTQTKLSTKPVAQIGEEIGLELGTQLINKFQEANPTLRDSYVIGREIIEMILSQPSCQGIRIFNAINENGENTLVYVGVDSNGKSILKYTTVSSNGHFSESNAIVADRATRDRERTRLDDDNEIFWDFE